MSSVAPPTTVPPAGFATWTEALTAVVLVTLERHDRFPLPGTGLVNHDREVSPPLVALLARNRAQG